jgi:hypothetical protein
MHLASRILWRKAGSQHQWVLPAKHDGQAIRMWPSAPQDYSFMNFSSPEKMSKNPYRPKGFLSIHAVKLFTHPTLLRQQQLLIFLSLLGGKNLMIISSMC